MPNIPVQPPEAKSQFEMVLDRIQDIASDPENKKKFLQAARLLLRLWLLAVKLGAVRFNDKQKDLNDGLTSAADDLLNPK